MKLGLLFSLMAFSGCSVHANMWTEDAKGNVIVAKTQKQIAMAEAGQLKHLNQIYQPFIIELPDTPNPKVVVKPEPIKPGELIVDNKGEKITGQSNSDIECLAYSIFREAGTLNENAQLAVGQVHINRLKDGSWGNKMCQVVHAKAQFSWTMERYVAWSDNQKTRYMKEAKALMTGLRVKKLDSEDVLHYHATYVEPKWAKQGQVVAKAGAHLFYKNVPY